MRISRDQVICRVPAFDLRAAFKQLSGGWSPSTLGNLLGVAPSEVEPILADLLEAGFVEPDFEIEGDQRFRLTIKGGALAAASALKPITRRRADELVEGIIQRAQEINADKGELYRIAHLWAFGSYVTNAETLGDVDIAVELERKDEEWPPIPDGEYAYAESTKPPRSHRGPFGALAWPQEAVLRRLKAKRNHISLHPHTDQVLVSAEKRQIFAG